MMTDAKRRAFVRKMFKLAEKYGVEDIEPAEMVYAVRQFDDGRGKSAKEIADSLWGYHPNAVLNNCDNEATD